MIVQRSKFATFELLTRTFAEDPAVRVIWDRRVRDRREAASSVPDDRRRRDRRGSPRSSWDHSAYLVVSVMADDPR